MATITANQRQLLIDSYVARGGVTKGDVARSTRAADYDIARGLKSSTINEIIQKNNQWAKTGVQPKASSYSGASQADFKRTLGTALTQNPKAIGTFAKLPGAVATGLEAGQEFFESTPTGKIRSGINTVQDFVLGLAGTPLQKVVGGIASTARRGFDNAPNALAAALRGASPSSGSGGTAGVSAGSGGGGVSGRGGGGGAGAGLTDIQRRAFELSESRLQAETDFLESSREIAEARWRDWNEIYAPLERQVVQEASIGRDPEIIADRARAAVAQQFERSREAGIRRLSQSGVTAGSPTGMQFLRGLDIGEAATRAGEANRARDTTMAQNEARRFNALSLGQGIPALAGGQSLQGANLAGGAGRGLLSLGAQTGEAAARLGLARDQFDQRERFGLAGLDLDRARLDFQRQSGLQNFTLNERRLDLQDPNVFGTQNYIRGGLALGGGLLSGKDFGTSALAGLEGLLR